METSKIAYLTIDDAPSADFALKVDYLYSKGIPAVFFCPGEALEKRPELVVEALHKGFVIGNHSYDHPHFSEITLEAGFEQIQKTDELLERIYQRAGVPFSNKYFRFPYGDKGALTGDDPFAPVSDAGLAHKQALQDLLRALGYSQPAFDDVTYQYYRSAGLLADIDWYWTYDVVEWSLFQVQHAHGIETLADVFARMDEVVPEGGRGLSTPGSAEIILTHDHVETTPVFPAIIERLQSKGLDFQLPT
jgi:peptidoglycan/xylan/chitin deacetylase (PgdA/CDA1 family)